MMNQSLWTPPNHVVDTVVDQHLGQTPGPKISENRRTKLLSSVQQDQRRARLRLITIVALAAGYAVAESLILQSQFHPSFWGLTLSLLCFLPIVFVLSFFLVAYRHAFETPSPDNLLKLIVQRRRLLQAKLLMMRMTRQVLVPFALICQSLAAAWLSFHYLENSWVAGLLTLGVTTLSIVVETKWFTPWRKRMEDSVEMESFCLNSYFASGAFSCPSVASQTSNNL